ncbi:uncharacterized protein LOC17884597 [Capsella rubella]|uniref:uncharacterized protein LOC17884597 n=1 Tax=Capsella rubella TaxID=81985 RepID=UPI000CD511F7|nr:uncharacterized protein LOC17884597 [Capsella rubella]
MNSNLHAVISQDNSLQAVWSCSRGERRLISVDVLGDRISIFDSGPGMDSSEANSIDKWGKIGASLHRSRKSKAVGGEPPYLMPFFGMFGYGGPYACMHLGRRTLVSSKTKQSKKVFTLQLNREALIDNRSVLGKNWKADGGMRDPQEEEMKLSPHGSFTKIEIFKSERKIPEIYQLQCRLKDIYFPYIQCDEISKTGRTERPVEFQVNGDDLAEIAGGKVATTNLNSKGREFWFQIRFEHSEITQGSLTSQEANARLKFVYLPIIREKRSIYKESINIILESLGKEGYKVSESFKTFSRLSVRRLGRLLPEVSWASIPFMEKGDRATTMQKICQRVICFVDLDAGFSPTPSKTDLASQSPFTLALKNFGTKSKEKDNVVNIELHRGNKPLVLEQVGKDYESWVLEMHKTYDEEEASGEDDAVVIFDSLDNKVLCISPDCKAVRVHTAMKRKGMTWKRGQKIRILKGACGGVHKSDVYATIDYFLIEGFDDEAGGDARIICRQINYSEEEGCILSMTKGVSRLELQSSSSFPISIIDSGMCLTLDETQWNRKIEKQREKDPSRIDMLDENDCRALNINGESSLGDSVHAGETPPQQIVAVVRPASFAPFKVLKKLDQKHIVKMDGEMLMEVVFQDTNIKSKDNNTKTLYSHRCFPTSCSGLHGLYIFPLESNRANLFNKVGIYNFCFSIGKSITAKKKVVVEPSSKVGSWKLASNHESAQQYGVQVGSSLPPCSIACFDEYGNQIPFTSVPSLEVELKASPGIQRKIDMIEANLIDDGILEVENILIETDWLDQIRPGYEATLEICSRDEPFFVSVACKVSPGPLKHVVEMYPEALKNLLPGYTVENYILEVFDGYNNHVAEGTNVLICTEGYCIKDSMGLNRKVDSCGCVDLSGILQVTAGYGKSLSLSVMSGIEEIFKKESMIEKRELRLLTKLPDCCAAGTNLINLKFKVTDSDGLMDTSIHDDEKSGYFHTMSIDFDSSGVESSIRYAFVHGFCKVPTLSLPESEGDFSIRVFHSRFPEIHMILKIQLTPAQTFERDEIGCSTPYPMMSLTPQSKMASTTNSLVAPTGQTPCSEFRVLNIRASSSALGSQTGLMDMPQFTELLKEKLIRYSEHRVEVEERLKCLEDEQNHAKEELNTLQASLEPLGATFPECLSTKESMMKQIEEKHQDTAASVFCCLYREAPPPQSLFLSKKGVFGLVALLGSVPSTSLSRVLSEYLGEDIMLALVCKSAQCVPSSAAYLRLQSEADKLGRSITNHRFHVLCLDAIRPWKDGLLENDPQKKLAMEDPKLSDGDPIPGFKGYAVNMIDLAIEELSIQTYSGYGLRETLFYSLFENLQVYETQKQVEAALPHINGGGAVSLDGFIAKGNGFIYSGCSKPEIHFPITVKENEEEKLRKYEKARDRVRNSAKKIEEEKCALRKLEKKLEKTNGMYHNATNSLELVQTMSP